jgi:hypothetical protein
MNPFIETHKHLVPAFYDSIRRECARAALQHPRQRDPASSAPQPTPAAVQHSLDEFAEFVERQGRLDAEEALRPRLIPAASRRALARKPKAWYHVFGCCSAES